jgi:hypothetical protein
LEAILNMAAILKSPMSLSHSICRKNLEYQFMLIAEHSEMLTHFGSHFETKQNFEKLPKGQ